MASSRAGYGWRLPGLAADRPGRGGSASSQIRVFSAKGLSAPGVLGTSPLPQIGTLIPGTPYIYIRPRVSADEGLLGGGGGSQARPVPGSVIITNRLYNFFGRNERTRSIGAAAAGSVGRNMDVAFQNEVPYFSIA